MASYLPRNREAMRAGRSAAVREFTSGEPQLSPYRNHTVAHRYWTNAKAKASRLIDELTSIGA